MQFRVVSQMASRGDLELDLWAKNPKGYGISRNPLFLLVAGAGYVECYTAPETHWIDLK